jgi:Uncharacterised nucleotidyltransferase
MSDDVSTRTAPLEDILAEADRLVQLAQARGIALRVAGGAGIALASPTAHQEPFARSYGDLDVAVRGSDRKALSQLLLESGYVPDKAFNAINGARRLYFWDTTHERQVDVFVDKVQMCHEIDLSARLQIAGPALNSADLLLLKLQIFEANEKDLIDIAALTAGVPFTEDESGINMSYLVSLTANDWGLWRTTTMIAERARDYARSLPLPADALSVEDQLGEYLDSVTKSSKSRRWNLRAKIGERKRWYELPEEEQHE